MRISYVDGAYVPHTQAAVSIDDRGFQFADSVYEVWAIFGGKLADFDGHMARLQRSLGELSIPMPMRPSSLKIVLKELVRRNRTVDGLLYLQVSRGVATRDHVFPDQLVPTVVATVKALDIEEKESHAQKGIKVFSKPDNRWGRCDIKTTGLLANCMAKTESKKQGGQEVFLYDKDGYVTEGGSSNAYIVSFDGVIYTRSLTSNILPGITRHHLLDVAESLGLRVEEKPFTVAEAKAAKEAFITAASSLVLPVVEIDGHPIGNGGAGEISLRLRKAYAERAKAEAI